MPRSVHLVLLAILSILSLVHAAVIRNESDATTDRAIERIRSYRRVIDAAHIDADVVVTPAAPVKRWSTLLFKRDDNNGNEQDERVFAGRKSKVGTPRPSQHDENKRDVLVPIYADFPVNVDIHARDVETQEVSSACVHTMSRLMNNVY